jgi:hypothetical protein
MSGGGRRGWRHPSAMVFLLSLSGWAATRPVGAEPALEERPPGVLELAEGGYLPGTLRPSAGPADTFTWESPLFARPLVFRTTAIVRVQFPRGRSGPSPPGPWRFDLSGGDTVCGEIVAVDRDAISVRCPATVDDAPLRLRRSWVDRIIRVPAGGRLLVPSSREQWQARGKPWTLVAGRPEISEPGTALWLDAESPGRACIELVLSWRTRPDLRIDVATPPGWLDRMVAGQAAGKAAAADEYRLELFTGRLLAIREGRAAKFEEIVRVPEGPGRLRLQVFVDRQAGRLAVRSPAAAGGTDAAAFDAAVRPKEPGPEVAGFGIKLRGGDVRIEELAVVPWTEPEPRLHAAERIDMATIESFEAAAGEFVIRDGTGTRRSAAMLVGEIVGPATVRPPLAGSLAVVADGLRLSGRIAAITPESVRCAAPGCLDPVVIPRQKVLTLEGPAAPAVDQLPGRVGWFETEQTRMLGCITAVAGHSGLAWQPCGAVAGVPFAEGLPGGRIDYDGVGRLGGPGIEPVRRGTGWAVATIVPQGPAARDGRLREGWMIEAIRQLPAGDPVAVSAVKHLDTVRSLLRGMSGSVVEVRCVDDSGTETRVALVRDASGRGDLAGAAEVDVLDRVLRTHDEQRGQPAGEELWPAVLFLVTGDSFRGRVHAANRDGVQAELEVGGMVTIPAAALRAIELKPAGVKPLPRQKMERLLTLPRMQRNDPPTHLVRTVTGDYIRGRLIEVDGERVTLKVLQETKSLPRADVARIIWLAVAGEPPPQAAAAERELPGTPVQVVTAESRRLTLAATGVRDGLLAGRSAACGDLTVDTGRCARILIGTAIEKFAPAELPYAQWVLREAGR